MKKLLPLIIFISIVSEGCHTTYVSSNQPPPPPPPAVEAGISYQTFYDELSPYGHWINYPTFGYVWMPSLGPDFRPYATNGHWVYSDIGWTWSSGYNWGWAPFHYGRWFYDQGYSSWMWVPGYEWAPAWVSWRRNTEYYGWAPLDPGYNTSVVGNMYSPPAHYWNFVPQRYVSSPQVNNYYVNKEKNVTIVNNTTVINNTNTVVVNNTTNNTTNNTYNIKGNGNNVFINNGPSKNEVETVTHNTIQPVHIVNSSKPTPETVNGNSIGMYRPPVRKFGANNNSTTPTPHNPENYHTNPPVTSTDGGKNNPGNGGANNSNNPTGDNHQNGQGGNDKGDKDHTNNGNHYGQTGKNDPGNQNYQGDKDHTNNGNHYGQVGKNDQNNQGENNHSDNGNHYGQVGKDGQQNNGNQNSGQDDKNKGDNRANYGEKNNQGAYNTKPPVKENVQNQGSVNPTYPANGNNQSTKQQTKKAFPQNNGTRNVTGQQNSNARPAGNNQNVNAAQSNNSKAANASRTRDTFQPHNSGKVANQSKSDPANAGKHEGDKSKKPEGKE